MLSLLSDPKPVSPLFVTEKHIVLFHIPGGPYYINRVPEVRCLTHVPPYDMSHFPFHKKSQLFPFTCPSSIVVTSYSPCVCQANPITLFFCKEHKRK